MRAAARSVAFATAEAPAPAPAASALAALAPDRSAFSSCPQPLLPQRLLIVSDAWEPQINGVVRSYQGIAQALEAGGCTVQVIGPDGFRRLPMPGYREIELSLAPARRLAAMIERFAPDALHIGVEDRKSVV